MDLVYSSGVQPSLFLFGKYMAIDNRTDLILNSLISELYRIIEDMAYQVRGYASQKNQTQSDYDVITYLNNPNSGNLPIRMEEARKKIRDEFEGYISAGLLLGRNREALISEYGAFLESPSASPILGDARRDKSAEIASIWLLSGGFTYGKNATKSGFTNTIRNAEVLNYLYNDIDSTLMKRNGATGYVVYRGSSYPCSACDENTGYHSFAEGYTLPVHGNCMCWSVPA